MEDINEENEHILDDSFGNNLDFLKNNHSGVLFNHQIIEDIQDRDMTESLLLNLNQTSHNLSTEANNESIIKKTSEINDSSLLGITLKHIDSS
jgi:hypothetical protein